MRRDLVFSCRYKGKLAQVLSRSTLWLSRLEPTPKNGIYITAFFTHTGETIGRRLRWTQDKTVIPIAGQTPRAHLTRFRCTPNGRRIGCGYVALLVAYATLSLIHIIAQSMGTIQVNFRVLFPASEELLVK